MKIQKNDSTAPKRSLRQRPSKKAPENLECSDHHHDHDIELQNDDQEEEILSSYKRERKTFKDTPKDWH